MKSDFVLALHIMGFLTAADGKPLSSTVLAETYGTNAVVVRRILAKLNNAGLVVSQRGVGGGSVLARKSKEVSLREVYDAVSQRPDILRRYPTNDNGPSAVLGAFINDLLNSAEEELLAKFGEISVSEMDEKVRPAICRLLNQISKDKNP